MGPAGMFLAISIQTLPVQLGRIFYFIVLPILILAGVGFLLQRTLGLDMQTLSRLNFYFTLPGAIYASVVSSELSGKDAGKVVLFSLLLVASLAVVTRVAAFLKKVPGDQRNTMLMTTMFYNSGNYGLPLQELAFRSAGLSPQAVMLQVFTMVFQNFISLTVGVVLATGGVKGRQWKQGLMHVAKFPPIYALAAALITVQIRRWLGDDASTVGRALLPFWTALQYLRVSFIAVALCALGAQVGLISYDGRRYPVKLSVALRLLGGPALGLALIYVMGLEGFLAQVLLISTTTPTAVNALLLSVEFRSNPDYTARAVFYSTLLSPITVTLGILLAQGDFLQRLVIP
jgi:predicted permease